MQQECTEAIVTLPHFISRLNWRQMLLQFLGMWLLMYAFKMLSFLRYPDIVEAYTATNSENFLRTIAAYDLSLSRVRQFGMWVGLADVAGLFCGFILSLATSNRRNWFWLNSFVGFAVLFIFRLVVFSTHWKLLRIIFLFGEYRPRTNIWMYFVIGTTLLGLGLFALFWKKGWRWIENGN